MNGDIELEVGTGSAAGKYVVRVLRAAAGGEPVGALELDVDELLSRRELLEATILASAVAHRSVAVAEQPVREVGRQLFEALFTGPVYGMYRASLGVAQQQGKRLRVVLRLTAPELAALPWEMLFDPETETYLCRHEPLVRHVHAPYTAEPLEVRPPLRVLGLVASPRGLPALDVDAEKTRLGEALSGVVAQGLIEVVWVPEATWSEVHAHLLAGQWHVLHFVGHGDYDTTTDEGVLALVGADGRADTVEAGRLADLLGEAQPTPRLVVLNSCSSGQSGTNQLFSGTAAALVRSGISAVAAMQFAISDTAAIAFARGFYAALAHGRGVDEAVRSGRISILGTPRSLEWVTPVLYLRGQASQLFTLAPPAGTGRQQPIPGDQAAAPPPPAERARPRHAELRALYVEACAELRLEHFDTAIGLLDDLLALDPDYPGASSRQKTAQRGQQLADDYTSAAALENADDWVGAARGYGEILQAEPAYRDTAARKEACERRLRVADLQAELRHHADVGQWQAVLAVEAELAGLDPSSSDPDGLASQARVRLAAVQRAAELGGLYTQACSADDRGDWNAAVLGYNEILKIDPAYRDAAASREACLRRIRVADLQSALEEAAAAENWTQVLTTIAELTELDPAVAAEPSHTGLATRARLELASQANKVLRLDVDWANWEIYAMCWHPDGSRIACATKSARARIFDISGNEPKEQLALKAGNFFQWPIAVAFSPDGTRLATGSLNSSARLWDSATGRQLLEVRHKDSVNAVAFSPDGTRLATGSADGSARLWDPATGHQTLEVRHGEPVNAVAFSPDGTRLATASADGSARLWDPATGHQTLEVRHEKSVTTVAFSPDGSRLAIGSLDGSGQVMPISG